MLLESNILFASASAFVGGEIQLTFGTRLFPSEPDYAINRLCNAGYQFC